MEVTESGIVNEVRLKHQDNVQSLMEVTELGIVNEVRLSQRPKAKSPMAVTESGIVNEGRTRHIKYLQPIITQYFIDNKSEIWLLFLIAHSKR